MIKDDTILQKASELQQKDFKELLNLLDHYYHNDESLVSDRVYDELVTMYELKYGTYQEIGSEPVREKVKLPYFLGSLKKIKEKELSSWIQNYPGTYILQDKIDGISMLVVIRTVDNKRITSLYTRGNGYYGSDVSHLLNYINLPRINEDIAVRGEIVLTKEAFGRVGKDYKNARNLVSGIVNQRRKFNSEIASEISFYAYHIMETKLTPEQEIIKLMEMGFLTPNPVITNEITKEMLEEYYHQRKQKAPYDIDGIVIYQNKYEEYPIGESPKHVVAFKSTTESVETTVTEVQWNVSKDNLLKPVVHFNPVVISGVEITKATGYNARYIVNNKIGPGARILITRSGDVIPKILSVITPAFNGPQLPDPKVYNYHWNDNKIELQIVEGPVPNMENVEAKLVKFLNALEIKNFDRKRIRNIVQAGVQSIDELIRKTPEELESITGLGPVLSKQLYQEIQERITNVPLEKIMDASGIFTGIGVKSFQKVIDAFPNLLEMANLETSKIAEQIRIIKGFKSKADKIALGLKEFIKWLQQNPMITIQPVINKNKGKLDNINVVFTGFRDKELEKFIISNGGHVMNNVSKNTTVVVTKDYSELNTNKFTKAKELGIPILSKEDFIKRYL